MLLNLINSKLKVEIDDCDLELASSIRWRLQSNGYVVSCDGLRVYLHKFILGNPNYEIDHRDRNKLNCKKENLRIPPSAGHNVVNRIKCATFKLKPTSKFKGVSRKIYKKIIRWQVAITFKNKQVYGGLFNSEIHAACYADYLYYKYFGDEFPVFNRPLINETTRNNTGNTNSEPSLFENIPVG